jgi:hypothetical protein
MTEVTSTTNKNEHTVIGNYLKVLWFTKQVDHIAWHHQHVRWSHRWLHKVIRPSWKITTDTCLCSKLNNITLTALVLFGIFREHSPAIFWRPQNIIKHALYLYGIFALYSLNPNLNPNQNRTHVPRYLLAWKIGSLCDRCASLFLKY